MVRYLYWVVMHKIFISYSRKDITFIRKLAGDLEATSYDVWWDLTDLRGGDDWVKKIPAAIQESDFFVIVLTPNSIQSEWVQKEYTQALNFRKKIIPIMFEQCDVPFALNTINFVNFMGTDYIASFRNLLSSLGYSGTPPEITPYERVTTLLPAPVRKYAALLVVAFVILIAFALLFWPKPDSQPPILSATETDSPTSTLTASATVTITVTANVPTPTPTVTEVKASVTPTSTNPPFEALTFCVNSLYSNTINVRSGPGTNYAVIGEPLRVGKCLSFRAVNESATWLLISSNQADPEFQQYEGGWIFRELLGLGRDGSLDLPAVTLTFTPTSSLTPTASNTPTVTPSPTVTPTDTPTVTPSPTDTETPEPSLTPTP